MQLAVKAVLLDLDGTLIDTAPEIAKAANDMLAALSLPLLSVAQIKLLIGNGAKQLIERSVAIASENNVLDAVLLSRASALFFEAYRLYVVDSKPYTGAETALDALDKRGFKLACVTNKPAAFTLPLLEKTGLSSYFAQIVSGDTLAGKKPDPIQLLHICAEFDVPVRQAVMVGDSVTDVAAAKAAGCYVATVPYGYNQGQSLPLDDIDIEINALTDLTTRLTLKH